MNACERFEIEIAAAAGGEVSAEVAAHLAGCPACARLREATLAFSSAGAGEPRLSSAAAVAMARRALAGPRRRAVLWVAPLLSASASAAALILYFGLAQPAGATSASRAEVDAPVLAPALSETREPELPDSLRALRELILTSSNGSDDAVNKS